MIAQGAELSGAERLALAKYLSAGSVAEAHSTGANCPTARFSIPADDAGWMGWDAGPANTRFQSAKAAGLDREKVARLKLKWAFGFAGPGTVAAQPVVAGGRLFIGGADGTVYSLDTRTGCQYWSFKAPVMVRSAISIEPMGQGRYALYFGDVKANLYALDAQTAELLWKIQVDQHPYARITGAPALYSGRLFVPVSSIEEVAPQNPKYP